MIIKYVNGHYEIVSADSGQFIQSADTWDEAVSDMEDWLGTADCNGHQLYLRIRGLHRRRPVWL